MGPPEEVRSAADGPCRPLLIKRSRGRPDSTPDGARVVSIEVNEFVDCRLG